MKLPKDFIDCVCFLCTKEVRGGVERWHYGGTAFLVCVDSETRPKDYCHLYLVTARHCIRDEYGNTRDLYVRLNKKDGTAQEPMPLPFEWIEPEDGDAADVAVMPFDRYDDPALDYKHVPIASAATEQAIRHHGIGLASDVYVTGLFTKRVGTKRNIPIVRAGVISAMMDDIEDEDSGLTYKAYLAELQSISGLSGSPVFAMSNRFVSFEKPYYPLRLLGLIRGHYDTRKRKDKRESEPVALSGDEWDKIHNGIAIVTPVQEILKLLEGKKLVSQRRKKDRELAEENAPTLDSDFGESQPQVGGLTREGFEEALRRASRKVPAADEEKNEP